MKRNIKRIIVFLLAVVAVFSLCVDKVNTTLAEENNQRLSGYDYYIVDDVGDSEDTIEVEVDRILDKTPINLRVTQSSYDATYSAKINGKKIGTVRVYGNVTYNIPTSNGEIAEYTSCNLVVTPVSNSTQYCVKSYGNSYSLENGNPARIVINVPVYKKSNNAYVNTIVIVHLTYT